MKRRNIMMTCALPYANGPIHLGHMLEHIEADIFARFQKMSGHECVFICADDTHGTPIMIAARNQGITPEALIQASYNDHLADFAKFEIDFDHYGSTHSEENKNLCELFYKRMSSKGHVTVRPVEQLYCEHDKMFLPDRFVKGTCPKCGATDQYGDSCDSCGATYGPNELKAAYCSICGNTPVKKSSDHIFFKLNDFKSYLQKWLPEHTGPETSKKMLEWFNEDLRDWDISRDEPYFGFQIPLENQPPGAPKKYFYVWVDAPMGYISAFSQWCKKHNRDISDYWDTDSKHEVYHFIGKDIVYFHTLFWPALLKAADFRTPTSVLVHGHVMVNGEKMSKSKGTFISAKTYTKYLDPQFLRYYYATKINGSVDDLDLSFDDFTKRVNSDLVGKIVNLASRGAQMLNKKFDSKMSTCDQDGKKILANLRAAAAEIFQHYDRREFSKATSLIRELTESVNKYFDEKAPWKSIETDPQATQQVLTTTLNAFRLLSIYLAPILPKQSKATAELLAESPYTSFERLNETLENHNIKMFEPLATRVDADQIKLMIEDQKQQFEASQKAKTSAVKAAPKSATGSSGATAKSTSPTGKVDSAPQFIEFEDFTKIDLRIAEILEASEIKEADKLLRIKIGLNPGETRQVIAGIKSAYKPESLVGRKVLVCANLKPRQMKFGVSEAMILAAGDGGPDLFLLSPDTGAKAGSKVK